LSKAEGKKRVERKEYRKRKREKTKKKIKIEHAIR